MAAGIARYDKIHLVPFGEYVPFKRLLTLPGKLTREVGGTLFPANRAGRWRWGNTRWASSSATRRCTQRRYASSPTWAQVFVNISDDGWYGDTAPPVQHLNMVRMRAIENHRWILRDTNTGVTSAIDPFGRVLARRPQRTHALDVPQRGERHHLLLPSRQRIRVALCHTCTLLNCLLCVTSCLRDA